MWVSNLKPQIEGDKIKIQLVLLHLLLSLFLGKEALTMPDLALGMEALISVVITRVPPRQYNSSH